MTTPARTCFGLTLVVLGAGCSPSTPPTSVSSTAIPQALFVDATDELLPTTAEWSHRVEAADIDGDGDIDLLFANGGDYSTPGVPELNRVFLNQGPGERFEESTLLGNQPDFARAIKVRDLSGDRIPDLIVACAYGTTSRLYLGTGNGELEEVTATHLPTPDPTFDEQGFSFGDVEVGDVDDDGDLDLVLADWGPGDPMSNAGGQPRLWLNQLRESGEARFIDGTRNRIPDFLVQFSWDLELFDVDNDFDLDLVISCKRCGGGVLLRGDGRGGFELDSRALPQYTNNYAYAGMDLTGDGFLDLVTVNDGDITPENRYSRREHILINNASIDSDRPHMFDDLTDQLWPDQANIGHDDNAVVFLDYDSDGDADFVLASLSGPDRLLINDGTGRLSLAASVFTGEDTPGTLGIALADLDGDDRLDVVMSQGEHETAIEERVFLGRGLEPDTAPPAIRGVIERDQDRIRVKARIHDRKSPVQIEDFRLVEARFDGAILPLSWYGGQLWRSAWAEAGSGEIEVCAEDRAGNSACSTAR